MTNVEKKGLLGLLSGGEWEPLCAFVDRLVERAWEAGARSVRKIKPALTFESAEKIRSEVRAGAVQKRVAEKYGVSQSLVCLVMADKIYTEERK
jgi:hypothetical protein